MSFFNQFFKGVEGVPRNNFYWRVIGKKRRLIGEPNDAMVLLQKNFRHFLENIAPRFHSSSSSKGGRGSVRNARIHGGQCRLFFKVDFSNAFGSVDGRALAEVIAKRVIARGVATKSVAPNTDEWFRFLSRYFLTKGGGLIQGSCVSPLMFELYCEVFIDAPIRKLVRSFSGFSHKLVTPVYSRFVDDIVVSVRNRDSFRHLRIHIREIIERANFKENHRKTIITRPERNSSIQITGPVVRIDGTIGIPRRKLKELKGILVQSIATPLFSDHTPSEIEGRARYLLDVLRGRSQLNNLESLVLHLYLRWCEINGHEVSWVKNKLQTIKSQKKKSIKRSVERKIKGFNVIQ